MSNEDVEDKINSQMELSGSTEADVQAMKTSDLLALLYAGGLASSASETLKRSGAMKMQPGPELELMIKTAQDDVHRIAGWIIAEIDLRIPVRKTS